MKHGSSKITKTFRFLTFWGMILSGLMAFALLVIVGLSATGLWTPGDFDSQPPVSIDAHTFPSQDSSSRFQNITGGKLGITQANLNILKTGKARAVQFSTLEALCRELGCQPGDILVGVIICAG